MLIVSLAGAAVTHVSRRLPGSRRCTVERRLVQQVSLVDVVQ